MNKTFLVVFLSAASALAFVACSKSGEQEPAQTPEQTYTHAQPTYDPSSYAPQPTATAVTTVTAAPAAGLAMQCASDTTCLTHRCDTATGRCAWPCQTNDDCQAGNHCISPLCVPAGIVPTQ